MFLLTQTAMGDSTNYEILSFEEVDSLKKERHLLAGRIGSTKRRLALETKLRDAAQSIGRLYSPPSPRSSGDYADKAHRTSRGIFGKNNTNEVLNKSDSELAASQRKCDELAQELLRLERREQDIKERLLQHTAGVLQMTHKGLKKPKNPDAPEDENAYDEFDERSLYRTPEHMDNFGLKGSINNGPQQSRGDGPSAEAEGAWRQHITELNNRVQSIVERFGLTRSPTLPPPPSANEGEGLEEQLGYLQTGIDGLESRVDGLLEQKTILTTQIQQQRELNSKSDAERDAHIGDLTEQLAHLRRDLDVAQRDGKAAQDELAVMTEQLDQMRHNGSSQDEAKASLVQAEGEISRLQSVVSSLEHESESLRHEADSGAEAREARARAEQQVAQLELTIDQMRSENNELVQDAEARAGQSADERIHEANARMEEAEARAQDAEARILESESLVQGAEGRIREAEEQRALAHEETARVQKEMEDMEGEVVRMTTELTMVKAELDGAYGTRAQRAAEVAGNPEIQKEIDALNARNVELEEELTALRQQGGGSDVQQRADTLEKELRETLDDYEAMTKASIEFEKERERFEGIIDSMRDRTEHLETQLSEERINWMNMNSPGSVGRDGGSETTSTMVLKNEFKKMMRDTRNENMKILRVSSCPSIYSSTKYLLQNIGRARGTSQNRRPAQDSQEGACAGDGQACGQPDWHSFMIMTLFCLFPFIAADCKYRNLSLYNMHERLTASATMLLPNINSLISWCLLTYSLLFFQYNLQSFKVFLLLLAMSFQPMEKVKKGAQPPHAQPRYYSKQRNIQRRDSVRKSLHSAPSHENHDSLGTVYSDERSITNAIRVATSNEGRSSVEASFRMGPNLEDSQAANMAMFLPSGSSHDGPLSSQHRSMQRPRAGGIWHDHVLSDQGPLPHAIDESSPTPENKQLPTPDTGHPPRRKATSLGAYGIQDTRPHWPRDAVPVAISPNQPRFPPLERSPTPPGLPSFNTQEAVDFATRLNTSNNASNPASAIPQSDGLNGGYGLGSYGEAIWRFLSRSSSTNAVQGSQPSNRSGIGRAPDGTIVQGRFPIRHSGHGTNHIRQIQDHQFHNPDLPAAQVSTERAERNPDQESIMKAPSTPKKSRNHVLLTQRAMPRLWTSRDARMAANAGNVHSGPSHAVPSPRIPSYRPRPEEVLIDRPDSKSANTFDKICWLPVQLYRNCCLGDQTEHETTEQPLHPVTSHDTYHTARSHASSRRNSNIPMTRNIESNPPQPISHVPATVRNSLWQQTLGCQSSHV